MKVWRNVALREAAPGEWGMAAGAALSGAALAAAFPPLDLGWLAAVALVPLWVAAQRCGMRAALRIGGAGVFAGWALELVWLRHVTIWGWLIVSAFCAASGLGALGFASWWGVRRRRGGAMAFALGTGVLWTGGEYLRGMDVFFGGFSWNPLGVAAVGGPLGQLAEWGGVWLVSLVLATANGFLAYAAGEWLRGRRGWRNWGPGVAGAVLLLASGWGAGRGLEARAAAWLSAGGEDILPVALVQTAIPQDEKWSSAKVESILARLRELSEAARIGAKGRGTLLVWPEAALPDDVRFSPASAKLAKSAAQGMGADGALLAGSLDTEYGDDGTSVRYFNAAFQFDAAGRLTGAYAKRHLVVGGEYLPFTGLLPDRFRAAVGCPENISPGTAGRVFRAGADRLPYAPLICFEDTLGRLARRDVAMGARLLVNLTNDAWFDPSSARLQHLRNAMFRAIECRVPLVRSANTGISCVVSPLGRVEAALDGPPDEPGVLHAAVRVPKSPWRTGYGRIGDAVGMVCGGVLAAWCVAAGLARRRRDIRFP